MQHVFCQFQRALDETLYTLLPLSLEDQYVANVCPLLSWFVNGAFDLDNERYNPFLYR